MASTKVRGITIELGADASGISKALTGVNKQIGQTQKDLKDVERLLKLDPTNTELLAQKQKLLNDKVAETKEKLDALKQAQASIDLSTEEGQRQYDALSREIISCEQELKDAEKAASGFNATAEKISATAGKMSQKFGDLANKTKKLSMVAGGALAGLAGLAVKAGQDADELNTLAKQTGVATDELQKMQYASELIDVDTDTIIGGLKKLKKNLDGHEDTWKRIGVEVKDANGQYKDITTVFYDTVKGLSSIENETERDIVAMELFGKSADDLAGVIDDGGEALKALGEEAENLGVIIPQEDLDRAAELDDELERLKAEILPTLTQLGIQVIDAVKPYLPAIKDAIDKICQALQNISPQMVLIVGGVLAVTAALSPMFSILSSLTGVISALTSSTGVLGGALGAISAPVLAVVAAIGALVAAFVTLWNTNEEFRNKVTDIWNRIKEMFSKFTSEIVQKLNEMGFDFKNFSEVVSGIWTGMCDLLAPVFINTFDTIANVLQGALDTLMGIFDVFMGIFTGDWERAWNGIKNTFVGIFNSLVEVFKGIINGITTAINTVTGGINKISGGKISIGTIPRLAEGGILTSGTAIVGEAGPELVQISNGQAMVQPLSGNLETLLETYLPYLAAGTQLVMDSGALVGSIAPDMNAALGTIAIRGGRR